MNVPQKLYKFCPIGVHSLRAISDAEVYHASPTTFNDPLDCNPTIQIDTSDSNLVTLLFKMLEGFEEMAKTKQWVDSLRLVTDPDGGSVTTEEQDAIVRVQLVSRIKQLLTHEYGERGVLSLSDKWDEPLLWSHYADQHRGICIEYDTKSWQVPTLGKVDYNALRSIRTNDLYRWKVDNDNEAEKRVYDTYFFAKAREWEYEREWRDVHPKAGVNLLHFVISAIHFGIRCDPVWQRMIVKLLSQNPEINLYEVRAKENTFGLDRVPIQREAFEQRGIQQPPFKLLGARANIVDSNLSSDNAIVRLLALGSEAMRSEGSPMGMFGRGPSVTGSIYGLSAEALTKAGLTPPEKGS